MHYIHLYTIDGYARFPWVNIFIEWLVISPDGAQVGDRFGHAAVLAHHHYLQAGLELLPLVGRRPDKVEMWVEMWPHLTFQP